jgi:hypothetical protein
VAAWQTFGVSRESFIYAVRRPLFTGAVRCALALDNVVFPGFRRGAVRNPVFIIGHPRSGTTFLHRLLTETREFCAFEAWEILLPSLLARRIFKGLIDRRIRQGRAAFFPPEVGHEGALDQVEEEELLLLHNGNTQFITCVSPLGFGDRDFEELVWADDQPAPIRRQTMAFLRGCLQRQIYWTGKTQVVAKMNYSGMRVRSLFEAFPDAKIVYVVRSPLETMGSHLTLHRNMFDHMWGLHRIPRARLHRYYERRYKYNVAFYRYLEDLIEKGDLPPSQFMVMSYDALRADLPGTIDTIADFAGLRLSAELRRRIEARGRTQKAYRRQHRNLHLEEFGLTAERVREDLAFVFDKYGFEK